MPSPDENRLQISPTHTVAGALAAVTSAVVGSRLGIAGTILGAGAGSVVATTGSAIYGHWIGRTAYRVRTVVLPATGSAVSLEAPADDPSPATEPAQPLAPRRAERRRPARAVGVFALGAATMFAGAVAAITAFEVATGHPLSSLSGADQGQGTTLGRVIGEPAPTPAIDTLIEPSTSTPSTTPTETPTSTPEVTIPTTTTPDPTTSEPELETPPPTSAESPTTPPSGQ